MIDKVYVINLDCRKDKWLAQRCAFLLMEVPLNRVERFPAIDGGKYSDLKAISEAMQADGFSCYTYPPLWDPWEGGCPRLACHWSHLKVLRKVAENDETALILEDDVLLSVTFRELENKLKQLQDLVQTPLDILFLESWFPSPADESGHSKIPCHEYSKLQESRMHQTNVDGVYKDFFGAGDRARVVTTRGAERLLELHNAYPWGIGEMLPWNIGLHQTELHTKTEGDFELRQELWRACERLSPFGFYAMKPEGIKHARELFDKQSDVWDDKNKRP